MLAVFLWACSENKTYVPVADATSIERIPKKGIYKVRRGETLYSIAWRYGLDYRDLAALNHLSSSSHILSGQIIYLRRPAYNAAHPTSIMTKPQYPRAATQTFNKRSLSKPYFESAKEPNATVTYWQWPAVGRVIGSYSAINKGINIAGQRFEPVYASAAGKVVYSGNGLRGYGNLIIIKHNSTFLTAYAHNTKNLVTEGESVRIGQVIAEMGDTGARRVMLHFEIRRSGLPVDPLDYLTPR